MPSSCTISIKAIPGAAKNEVVGWAAGELKVRVCAPALEGRANEALCEFLADELAVPRRSVAVVRGLKSRHKIVRVLGLSQENLGARWQRTL
jgi:uncharacterized protein (TIGR00251 family)